MLLLPVVEYVVVESEAAVIDDELSDRTDVDSSVPVSSQTSNIIRNIAHNHTNQQFEQLLKH